MTPATLAHDWLIIDSGPLPGRENMAIDANNLRAINEGEDTRPKLRFFQWKSPAVSFGYLLDEKKVRDWARQYGEIDLVKRPTGGGAVVHQTTDLSLSLLWPRGEQLFPEDPRSCYAAIHKMLMKTFRIPRARLYAPSSSPCQPDDRFSLCFNEPVEHDVMVGDKKVIGGALRITRRAILYQGNILMGQKKTPPSIWPLAERVARGAEEEGYDVG